MADRENVIRGLKACNRQSYNGSDCQNCPYYEDEYEADMSYGMCNIQDMFDDAIALLKEQEARVMTMEEVIHSRDWIWYELKNTHCGWTIAVNCDGKWIEWDDLTTDQLCKYGKKWRCWTSRPTPEQMRETPWEENDEI